MPRHPQTSKWLGDKSKAAGWGRAYQAAIAELKKRYVAPARESRDSQKQDSSGSLPASDWTWTTKEPLPGNSSPATGGHARQGPDEHPDDCAPHATEKT